MKRQALIIGNTDGLPGVQNDLNRFKNFLLSDDGGAWLTREIFLEEDIRLVTLENMINLYKQDHVDYMIVFFSGHGGQKRETYLSLNKFNETITETKLQFISPRQINIYDCCRCYPQPVQDSMSFENRALNLSESFREQVRDRFDRRIMKAREQQVTFYSCSKGEYSYDTGTGGRYITNFLSSAKKTDGTEKLAITAHEEAKVLTVSQSNGRQNPDYEMPKLPSAEQLVISIG